MGTGAGGAGGAGGGVCGVTGGGSPDNPVIPGSADITPGGTGAGGPGKGTDAGPVATAGPCKPWSWTGGATPKLMGGRTSPGLDRGAPISWMPVLGHRCMASELRTASTAALGNSCGPKSTKKSMALRTSAPANGEWSTRAISSVPASWKSTSTRPKP